MTQPLENDEDLAVRVLREIIADPNAPAQSRAQCCRTLLELKGKLGRSTASLSSGGLADMTADELDAEIARLSASAKGRKRARTE